VKISAYIPCYNNTATLPAAIASVRALTPAVDELYVVDDGSHDGSAELAAALGVEVLREPLNRGRGHARDRAMRRARGEFVLSLDATNALPPDFLARALPWFDDPRVAGAFGRIVEPRRRTATQRWRARHLFKNDVSLGVGRRALLITYGTLVRRSAIEAAGGYDASLAHSEDKELGLRLLQAGHQVVYDPALHVASLSDNTVLQVLERHWRWYAGVNESFSARVYLRQTWYCLRTMLWPDLSRGDLGCAAISALFPAYILGKVLTRRLRGTGQTVSAPRPLPSP
jgi:glycosyltransferase involved in cell wall biosynthesis